MKYGTTGSVITKEAAFGKTLTNGNAEIANYNLFAITLKVTTSGTAHYFTFPYTRGQNNARQGGRIGNYWYNFQISLSTNTFSATVRYGENLSYQSAPSVSINSIRGIG